MRFSVIILLGFVSQAAIGACLVDPVEKAYIYSPYGVYRVINGTGSVHQGWDVLSDKGNSEKTPLLAAGAGEIVYAGFRGGGYGNMVAIKRTDEHTGDIIAYKHIRNTFPKQRGSTVRPGELVGYMSGTGSSAVYRKGQKGNFGIHLHMEYLAKPSQAVQYEIKGNTGVVYDGFRTVRSKGYTDSHLAPGSHVKYTDPSPYFCNSIPYKYGNQSLGVYKSRFKNTMDQYNFVMTKLGKKPGINSGDPPSIGEYSAAENQVESEIACAANADVLETNAAAGISVAGMTAASEAVTGASQ